MKVVRFIAFVLCLTGWSWWGWYYGYPLATFYFDLLENRQGPVAAPISFWTSLVILLWVYYAAAMNLKRAIDKKEAPWLMKVLGYTLVLPPGLFLDWLVNMIPMTVISGDLPKSFSELVTGRLDRYSTGEHGWYRFQVSKVFGLILHALDPRGYHYGGSDAKSTG